MGDYETSRLAYEIERKDLGLSGGKQDQYAAAFGGFNYMEFLKEDLVIVNPLKIKRWIVDELEASIVLYFTGASRSSAKIINEPKENTSKGNSEAIEAMHQIKQSAVDMKLALLKGDMHAFAEILGKGWVNKKQMANALSNPMIQEAFDVAIPAGAMSGKVSGAGGGGFIMFMVEPTKKKDVISALSTTFLAIALFGLFFSYHYDDCKSNEKKVRIMLAEIGRYYSSWIYILHPIFITVIVDIVSKLNMYSKYIYVAPFWNTQNHQINS